MAGYNLLRLISKLKDIPGIVQKSLSFLGKKHIVGGPDKKLGIQLILQGKNLLADSRLRDKKLGSGILEIQRLSHLYKTFQLGSGHVQSPCNN